MQRSSTPIITTLPVPASAVRAAFDAPRPAGIGPDEVADYLTRLGVEHPGAPSLAGLFALHRAHVERVPYEVLDIQLQRPTTVDPRDSADAVQRGRGGYCVQLNGAFSQLLAALGYDVTWHRAGVQAGKAGPAVGPGEPAPHLALTVRLDGRTWLVDVGLGDGLHDPLPLRAGTYRQGPFTFRLAPSEVEPGAWRFDHDPRGAIAGMDFSTEPAGYADFAEWHHYLVTSPESRLVRAIAVMRRDADSADSLTGCMLRRIDADGKTVRELSTEQEWYGALAEVFGLRLGEVPAADRTALWTRVRGAHEAWQAARAARAAAA
jgi:N-hydroxyarylamine O-acetyltransferase